jgi:hypothetical protein
VPQLLAEQGRVRAAIERAEAAWLQASTELEALSARLASS